MKIVACYIRVSTAETKQAAQKRQIERWLKANRVSARTVRWYIDKSTGDVLRQPKLDAMQTDILDGKVRSVVVSHFDRLAATTRDGLTVLTDWCDRSLRIVSVGQQIDVKSKDCKTIASVLRGVAEMDERTRRERTMAGLAVARANGRSGGRPKLATDDAKVRKAKKLHEDYSLSIADICVRLKISRSTYYRYVSMD